MTIEGITLSISMENFPDDIFLQHPGTDRRGTLCKIGAFIYLHTCGDRAGSLYT
jgi:hypothetical protein